MRALLLCLLAAGLSAGNGKINRHRWADAIELRSRHYVVETNTFPEVARSLSDRLEEGYILFQERFGVLHRKAARRMRIQLFRTAEEYMRIGDGVKGAVGHFDAARDRCAFAWRRSSGATGWPIAVHEACHHYLRRRHPHLVLPSWYAEGIACYFEGLQDETVAHGISRVRVRTARTALREGEASLTRLLDARARIIGGELRLDTYTPVRYYALAWSFVHFLATDERYRKRFRRFELRLFNTANGNARQILIEECGGTAALERGWRNHLAALAPPAPPVTPPVYPWELVAQNPWVRYAALNRLEGKRVPPDLEAGVRRCLNGSDAIVRTAAVRVTGKCRDATTAQAMLRALDFGDSELKRAALHALAHPSARAAVPRLLAETEERRRALDALASIGDPRAFAALREGLIDDGLPSGTRALCAGALGHETRDLPYLRLVLDDKARSIRNAAQAALLRLGEEAQGGRLRRALDIAALIRTIEQRQAEDHEKIQACTLLGLAGDQRAVPALQRLCRADQPDPLRLAAARALVRITGETRGFQPGQPARSREAALRRWAADG